MYWKFKHYKKAKCEEFRYGYDKKVKAASYITAEKRKSPLNGAWCIKDVIYQAEVEDDNGQKKVYIGCTEDTFKKCWYDHASFSWEMFHQSMHCDWKSCPAYHWLAKTLMTSDILPYSCRSNCWSCGKLQRRTPRRIRLHHQRNT